MEARRSSRRICPAPLEAPVVAAGPRRRGCQPSRKKPVNGPALAALWTPAGRGAIATIRVSVEWSAWQPLDALPFRAADHRLLSVQPGGRIVFGRWGAGLEEDVVVCAVDRHSLEIHCHGGQAAARRILRISRMPAAASSAGRRCSAPPNHRFVPKSSANCAERPRCRPRRFFGSRRTASSSQFCGPSFRRCGQTFPPRLRKFETGSLGPNSVCI